MCKYFLQCVQMPTADEEKEISQHWEAECRDAGTGGGGRAVEATCPTTLKLWGRRPPTLDCESHSFLFLFVFARELGSLPKNSGTNPGSF